MRTAVISVMTASSMTMDDLREFYAGLLLPEEQEMARSELESLWKSVALWQALDISELRELCRKLDAARRESEEQDDTLPEANAPEERDALVQRLIDHNRLEAWDSRGFEASRLGNVDTVMQVVLEFEQKKSMNIRELHRELDLVAVSDGSPSLLYGLCKRVLVWRHLPLEKLHDEAQKLCNVPAFVTQEELITEISSAKEGRNHGSSQKEAEREVLGWCLCLW